MPALHRALLAGLVAGCAHTTDNPDLVNQLDREVIALKEHNAMLRKQVQDCDQGGPAPQIYTELYQVFSGTEVEVERQGRLTVVTIPGSLLFRAGSTDIREEARMVIDMLGTALGLHPDTHVRIVGYTDDQPLTGHLRLRYGTNWELSALRAAQFMHSLVDGYHLSPDRFTISGRGPVDPIASNDTPEGRALNRRIEVVIGPGGPGW